MELSSRAIARRAKTFLRNHELGIFVPVLPGLEQTALDEIEALGHNAIRTTGGVSLRGNLATVYATNLMHRTGNRVLIRIDSFLAQSYPMLYDHTKKLPWEILLGNCPDVEVKVAFAQSRLRNKSHIRAVVRDAIIGRCKPLGLSPGFATPTGVTIFLRLHQDRCTISLDSTGTHLHKRGYRVEEVTAPIRETTAAGILSLADASSYQAIVDPFCGSGTFCIEAEMLVRRVAPGLKRSFAIERTPLHSAGTYSQVRREVVSREMRALGVRILGSDIEPRAVESAHAGLARAKCSIARFRVSDALNINFQSLKTTSERGLIVANLPYGRRLSTPAEVQTMLVEFKDHLLTRGAGWDFALVTAHPDIFANSALMVKRQVGFTNGGLRVVALLGAVP